MPELVQGPRTGGFVVSEGNGNISREQIVLASGNGALDPGTVLGQLTADDKFVPLNQDGVDGSEVAAAILYAGKDTTDADQDAVAVVRDAEVKASQLIWPGDIDPAEITTALAELEAVGIIDR